MIVSYSTFGTQKMYQRTDQEVLKGAIVTHYAKLKPKSAFILSFKLYLSNCQIKNPSQCFVRLSNCTKVVSMHCSCRRLRPLDKPKTEVRYSNQAFGHNKLHTTVLRLCKAANDQALSLSYDSNKAAP